MLPKPDHLQRLKDYAPFLLRVVCAWKLYDAAGHTALHPAEGIPGYADWLSTLHFPFPVVAATLSAYTEFLGAISLLLGWKTRWFCIPLVINFILAVIAGHWAIGDSFTNTFPALILLATSLFLGIHGPGKPSIDEGI
ncbi:DoxX family protein [Arsenicibacter rosenii]|uniref:DoxX family protein n=1 Tax=Arsenicibacter rosenii TaxID=1750698 RepID=A0A1S2VN78_9BACT|nr:DoxX family protein [Arsenicibacter rosenii]OIN59665.1 hypothetical protein BLX24_07285 [Arsenicibacter rosenii]